MSNFDKILNSIEFNEQGLVPVIAQQYDTNEVLMMAWMNKEALIQTLKENKLCYFSRSRQKLWKKGETSGQTQILKELTIDCDGDTLLAKVDQNGVACHTGRKSCFFKTIKDGKITINQDVLISPDELYKNDD